MDLSLITYPLFMLYNVNKLSDLTTAVRHFNLQIKN